MRRASCACERTECQRNFLIGIVFVRMFPLESIVASQRRLFVHKGTSRSIAAFAVFVLIAYFSLSAAAQAAPALRVASELSSLTHHTRHNIRGYFTASNSSSKLRHAKIHRFHSLRAILGGHLKSKFILFADQFSQIQKMKFITDRESRTLWTSSTERRGRGRLRG